MLFLQKRLCLCKHLAASAWASDLEPVSENSPSHRKFPSIFYDFKTDILTVVTSKGQQETGCVVHLKEKKMERNLFSEASERWRKKLAFKRKQQILSDLELFLV